MTVMLKDPDAILDYGFCWTSYLDEGEEITASLWLVTPQNSLLVESDEYEGGLTRVLLSGGVAGAVYSVTNRIVTSHG